MMRRQQAVGHDGTVHEGEPIRIVVKRIEWLANGVNSARDIHGARSQYSSRE